MKANSKAADLYRMVTEQHICPFGLKSSDLLEREGFSVNDHRLTTRAETDAFMAKHRLRQLRKRLSAASGLSATMTFFATFKNRSATPRRLPTNRLLRCSRLQH